MNDLDNPEIQHLPHNLDLEYAIIGWVLTKNELMNHLSFLRPEDFYSKPHADIFAAMQKLHEAGDALTPFTLIRHIKNPESFEDTTGGVHKYLASAIVSSAGNLAPIDDARYLLQLSQRRRLILACQSTIAEAYANEGRPEERIVTLTDQLGEISKASQRKMFYDGYEVTERILNDLKGNNKPYSTGFKKLDEAMGGGIYPGKSYGFAAKKKMGKTILAGSISHSLNEANVKHLFICGEMSKEEVHQRVLARVTESFPSAFRNEYGKTAAFGQKLAAAAHKMNRASLYVDAPGLTFDELKLLCMTATERHGITGFILDYWQLVGGKPKGKSTSEHLDEVAQWVADYCRKKKIWSITMAQINQDGNTRGGEGIRLACDQVYQIRAPKDDPSRSGRWIEMMDTRYTGWCNIGTEDAPGIFLNEMGPYFYESTELML